MGKGTFGHEATQDQKTILIFRVRRARQKAMKAAIAEALSLLAEFNPTMMAGGPLGDQPGLFWLEMEESVIRAAMDRLPLLGYTSAVDMVKFSEGKAKRKTRRTAIQPTWRG